MSVSIRFYLFAEDGLQRLSKRLVEGLVHGKDAMPQYAGTRQKTAEVYLEVGDGKPVRIVRAEGTFLTFDEKGQVHRGLQDGFVQAIETFDALERAERRAPSKIVDLSPKLRRDQWERENRWKLSKEDLDRIADDIWKRKRAGAPQAQQAHGISPKPIPLTYEAKNAIDEIATHVYGIEGAMEHLSEPAFKGIAFEARKRASKYSDNKVWLAVAEAADRRREIASRYRTGKGIWYASIDLIRWDRTTHSGHSDNIVSKKCNSKEEAEEAARKLLAENAKYFSTETTVEAEVVCDLEWSDFETEE